MPLLNFTTTFPDVALTTLSRGFRNGHPVPAESLRRMSRRANVIATQRQKILFQKSIRFNECYNSTAAASTWRCQFHVSPNCEQVRVVHVVAPVEIVGGSAIDARIRWNTTIVGGASTDQAYLHHNVFDTATATVIPDGMTMIEQVWSVTADTKYRATLTQQNKLRVLSATIYEVPKTSADPTDTNIVDPRPYYERGPIYDVDTAEVQTVITKLWKTMGTHHFAFCVDSTTGQTVTGTTWNNLIDGTTTAIGANTQGFQTRPNYHGALDGYDSSANTEGIPITIYAYLQTASGGTAECRFIDGTGTIGTLTSTSTTGEWVTSDVTWTVDTAAASEKIDVMFRNATSAKLTTCMAAGLYEFEA